MNEWEQPDTWEKMTASVAGMLVAITGLRKTFLGHKKPATAQDKDIAPVSKSEVKEIVTANVIKDSDSNTQSTGTDFMKPILDVLQKLTETVGEIVTRTNLLAKRTVHLTTADKEIQDCVGEMIKMITSLSERVTGFQKIQEKSVELSEDLTKQNRKLVKTIGDLMKRVEVLEKREKKNRGAKKKKRR